MEPADLALPELDLVGHHPEAPPVGRPRDLVPVPALLRLPDQGLEIPAAGERAALRARPGADPALARPRREVLVRFGGTEPLVRAVERFSELIRQETQAVRLETTDGPGETREEWNLNGEPAVLSLKRV